MKILTADQMREADRRTISELGIPGCVLMENAARAVTTEIVQRYSQLFPGPVAIFCGKGNNGGDGFAVARNLLSRGWQVKVYLLADASTVSGDARLNFEILQRLEAEVACVTDAALLDAAWSEVASARLLIDALFGTGLSTTVGALHGTVINWMNRHPAPVVAIDIPSGLDATTGCILGVAVQADLTVSLAAAKLGQIIQPGAGLCGELVVVEIGIPDAILTDLAEGQFLDAESVRHLLPARPSSGHKGTFGHLLLLAGSLGKSGAATLAAEAALRAGVGLVTVAAPFSVQPLLATKLTEAMTAPLAEVNGEVAATAYAQLVALCEGKTVLALGPGLGRGSEVTSLVRQVVGDCPLPLVIDADGLFALAGHLEMLALRPVGTTILTPHPGEMAHLLGSTSAAVEADRLGTARRFAEAHGVILVLKGARTVIAAPDGGILINPTGHVGMATGGMGDLLTGIIAGLLAQGAPPLAAAAAGVWLHGRSADRLFPRFGNAGLLASDLLAEIPAARCEVLAQ